MGFPESGKTSTQRFIFQKIREEELLNHSIQPTVGVEISTHKLMDMDISFFDTSGQELNRWFESDLDVLDDSELIVFFFSTQDWQQQQQNVQVFLQKLKQISDHSTKKPLDILIFCHKIDLIPEQQLLPFTQNVQAFVNPLKIPLFFTTLLNDGNEDLIMGVQKIIERYSVAIQYLQKFLKTIIQKVKIQPLLLLDDYIHPKLIFHAEETKKWVKEKIQPVLSAIQLQFKRQFESAIQHLMIQSEVNHEILVCVSLKAILAKQFRSTYLVLLCQNMNDYIVFVALFQEYLQQNQWNLLKS
jgi:signal recognition particle receptor subunit beta